MRERGEKKVDKGNKEIETGKMTKSKRDDSGRGEGYQRRER